MKTSELLKDLELGSDVAEGDAELRNYFIQTHVYRQVIHDDTDLILGPKGSGKTAIFRMLSDPNFEIPAMSDAVVIPAFNVQGSVLFRELPKVLALDEGVLRKLWTAYILSLAGNHLVENYPPSETGGLRTDLRAAGLLAPNSGTPRGIWASLISSLRRLLEPSSVQARVDLGDGLPGFEGRVEYESTSESQAPATQIVEPPPWLGNDFDSNLVTEQIISILERATSRCWVIFDRLDEAFEDASEERSALRGLMRAQADLSSYNETFRVKLFLRSDVMDRVTKEAGFVNITHFRTVRISWERHQIRDLVVSRLSDSDAFLRYLHSRGETTKEGAIRALFSAVQEGRQRSRQTRVPPFTYMVERTLDASAEFNPRNVVSFLREARGLQLDRCQMKDVELQPSEGRPIITQDSMVKAWRAVSEKRLMDTLYAEFNAIRPAVEKFRNGPQRFDKLYLARTLGFSPTSSQLDAVISELEYCGFMTLQGRRIYRVGDLYRPALGLNPKWEE